MEALYRIECSPELGKYAIAATQIQAGTVILEENPFVVGPKLNTGAICLGCYNPVNGGNGGPRCKKCSWPMCENCASSTSADHNGECEIFSKANAKFQAVEDGAYCPQLDCITPLRLLLKKEADPKRWSEEVATMEYHDDSRRKDTENWHADIVNVAKYLQGPCKLADRFTEDEIMQAIGILGVNAFEGKTSAGYPLYRCVFPKTAILGHNCVPNVKRSIYPSENFKIRTRALVNIAKDEQIYNCYTYILSGTSARQAHIRAGKYFTCHCKRCSDPTELGTHFSSFKCNKCDPGLIVTTHPFDDSAGAEWKCSDCEFKTTGNAIRKAISVMQDEIDAVSGMEFSAERLESTERLYKKYRSVLHPLHFLQTSLRESLIQMYGHVEGYEISELPDVLLEHKEELCRQVLKVLDIFEPGLSRSRAFILYELHAPIVLIAKTAYSLGVLSGEPLKKKLQNAIDILTECAKILKDEDAASEEAVVAIIAQQAAKQLEASIVQMA